MNTTANESTPSKSDNCVVWRILDGKAGHESQTLGLLNALKKRVAVSGYEIEVSSRWKNFLGFLCKNFEPGKSIPPPDLIMGAGSRTHFALLAANRKYGGKTIVLMQPTLPNWFFDLCLIPKHDSKKPGKNTVSTNGVLNSIQPATSASPQRGLFLIGGPSTHYSWDSGSILDQVVALVQENPEIHWTLTTSRRTPVDCTQSLVRLDYPNLEIVPVEKTTTGWVAEKLQECKIVWVTEDSVSMVYESLTAGAQTGLLTVPALKQSSRVQHSVRLLLEQKRVVRFEERDQLFELRNETALAEADRCADHILQHLLHG